MSLHRYVIL